MGMSALALVHDFSCERLDSEYDFDDKNKKSIKKEWLGKIYDQVIKKPEQNYNVFFVRQLSQKVYEETFKCGTDGHSTAFILSPEKKLYFFDPNNGLDRLKMNGDLSKDIFVKALMTK